MAGALLASTTDLSGHVGQRTVSVHLPACSEWALVATGIARVVSADSGPRDAVRLWQRLEAAASLSTPARPRSGCAPDPGWSERVSCTLHRLKAISAEAVWVDG